MVLDLFLNLGFHVIAPIARNSTQVIRAILWKQWRQRGYHDGPDRTMFPNLPKLKKTKQKNRTDRLCTVSCERGDPDDYIEIKLDFRALKKIKKFPEREVVKQSTLLLRERVVSHITHVQKSDLLCTIKSNSYDKKSMDALVFSLAVITINCQAFLFLVIAFFAV